MACSTPTRYLAPCTNEAITFIQRYTQRVVEIGAGEGLWAKTLREAGLHVTAFDINPCGDDVLKGDHNDAAQHEGALLMVWPPDGNHANLWLKTKAWDLVLFCRNLSRSQADFSSYEELSSIVLPFGRKGGSTLTAYKRIT